MNKINEPLQLGGWQLPNRVVFQPMEGCDGTFDGGVGELTFRRYMRFAGAGAAILWFEAVAVRAEGRANPRQLFLSPGTADSFKRLLEAGREQALKETGAVPKIIIQLTHAGRFSKPRGTPAPLVAYRNAHWEQGREDQPYQIVTDDYCAELTYAYADAAKLSAEVGFDGADVKCCHGYLLNEFLSAYDRPGRYGGCFENRARLFLDCMEAARQSLPAHTLLTTRLNACDGFPFPHGYGVSEQNEIDLTECKEVLRILRDRFNCEMVNITLGNPYLIPHINRPARIGPEPGDIGMERIRAVTGELQSDFPELAIAASGLSFPGENCVEYADALLEEDAAKLAGFGRMTFAYPDFFRDFTERGRLDRHKTCLACGKCTQLMRAGTIAGCPVRDTEVYMPYYKKYVKD
ncbi:MAG: flavin oxidoreductase/NADH oxidase [Oscillospiraceae bacterium]|nr:flavin oxidoreductase/NADH oxidase [Oscillospiraceae bacterium]